MSRLKSIISMAEPMVLKMNLTVSRLYPTVFMPTAMISHANPIVFMLTMIVGRRQTIDSHKMTGIT